MDAKVVRLGLVLRPPHLLQQLPLGDETVFVADENFQQRPLGGGQPDVGVAPDHAFRRQVHGEIRGHPDRLVGGGRRPADRGAEPGQQLVHAERLGDVVVRAGVQGGHLLDLLAPRRQHDDRRGRPAADAPDHLGAVHVGQAEVEDQHVRAVPGHRGQPGRAVRRGGDLVLAGGEVDPQGAEDGFLVVDDEDPGHLPAVRPGRHGLAFTVRGPRSGAHGPPRARRTRPGPPPPAGSPGP